MGCLSPFGVPVESRWYRRQPDRLVETDDIQSTETARALSFKARPGLPTASRCVTMSRIRLLDISTTLLIICVATRPFSSPLSQRVVKRRFGA